MRFGYYGVRSGHTESFIAGDRERPIADGGYKAKTRKKRACKSNLSCQQERILSIRCAGSVIKGWFCY